jgi:hypothetical protein
MGGAVEAPTVAACSCGERLLGGSKSGALCRRAKAHGSWSKLWKRSQTAASSEDPEVRPATEKDEREAPNPYGR